MKYIKKTKSALWTAVFPGQVKSGREKRSRPKTLVEVFLAEERKFYKQEARAFVQAAIDRGETCPVVAAVPELRNGWKYGHPISNSLNEVHHTRGRGHGGRSPLLRDQRFWLAVSKQGHRWIHANPDKARQHGWLCERGLWNVAP